MAKFKKSSKGGSQEINASSMSDVIFMLLFFFMTVTTMKEVEYKVQFQLPEATELTKLEKKSLVTYIYIGPPTISNRARMGSNLVFSLTTSTPKFQISRIILPRKKAI